MTQIATCTGMTHRLVIHNGSASDPSVIEESHRIRDWLLEILRFAVTLEQCDRVAVMSLAQRWTAAGPAQPNRHLAISPRQAQSSATASLQRMTAINWRNSAFLSKKWMIFDCGEPLKARSSRNLISQHLPGRWVESISGRVCR